MSHEFSNPRYIPAASFDVLDVADAAARLALPRNIAEGRAIRQLDAATLWALKAGGHAAHAADWVCMAAPAVSAGVPVNAAAASLTVDPAGADNAYILTAVAKGTAGNAITHTLLSPVFNQSDVVITVTGTDIVVAPGAKAQMSIAGVVSPDWINDGADPERVPQHAGVYGGKPYWLVGNTTGPGDLSNPGICIWWGESKWHVRAILDGVIVYHATKQCDIGFPDASSGPIPWVIAVGSGVPLLTAIASPLADVGAAFESSTAASALVSFDLVGGKTGAVAAVPNAHLNGGVDATPGGFASMKVAEGFLFIVDHLDGNDPVWKKLPLSAL